MVLQAFQITRPCGPVLNRAILFQAVVEGSGFFKKNLTLLSIESIGRQCSYKETRRQKRLVRITGSNGVKVVLALKRLLLRLCVRQN